MNRIIDKAGSSISIQRKLRDFREGNPIRRVVPEGHVLKLNLPESSLFREMLDNNEDYGLAFKNPQFFFQCPVFP